MSQGGNANISGEELEQRVEFIVKKHNIAYVKQHQYKSPYGHNAEMDFYLTAFDMAVECKNQNVSGSVDEKIPYTMETLEQHPAKKALLILGGVHWVTKRGTGIKAWADARAKKSDKCIQVIYEDELEAWLEQTNKWDTTK
jgi:hypothetical protein